MSRVVTIVTACDLYDSPSDQPTMIYCFEGSIDDDAAVQRMIAAWGQETWEAEWEHDNPLQLPTPELPEGWADKRWKDEMEDRMYVEVFQLEPQ